MKRTVFAMAILGLALSAGAALAHHSYAMFDRSKELVLAGTVREFQWTNPHSWIKLEVADAVAKARPRAHARCVFMPPPPGFAPCS